MAKPIDRGQFYSWKDKKKKNRYTNGTCVRLYREINNGGKSKKIASQYASGNINTIVEGMHEEILPKDPAKTTTNPSQKHPQPSSSFLTQFALMVKKTTRKKQQQQKTKLKKKCQVLQRKR